MSWAHAVSHLMPASVIATLPPLYSTEHSEHPRAVVKLFSPDSSWSWFVIEGGFVDEDGLMLEPGSDDGIASDFLLFCLVDGFERETGYVSLTELAAIRGPKGMPLERDLHFKPCRVSEL